MSSLLNSMKAHLSLIRDRLNVADFLSATNVWARNYIQDVSYLREQLDKYRGTVHYIAEIATCETCQPMIKEPGQIMSGYCSHHQNPVHVCEKIVSMEDEG